MAAKEQVLKAAPQQEPPPHPFTMSHLRRVAIWGSAAAGALLVAVLTGRSEIGSQRIAAALSHGKTSPWQTVRGFDAKVATERLAEEVRGLASDNKALRARIASVEHNMDGITGSISRQIEAAEANAASPRPAGATVPAVPGRTGNVAARAVPESPGAAAPVASLPELASVPQETTAPATGAASKTEYGVDIGSALSIEVLRARWLGIRSAHARLFDGLTPTAVLHEFPHSSRVELRLVVGPLASSEAAARLCAKLAPYRLFCKPTAFDTHHVVLR